MKRIIIGIFGIIMIFCLLPKTKPDDIHEIKAKSYVAGQALKTDVNKFDSPLQYLGDYELTAYCSCAACCGTETGLTASGTYVEEGRTVACNSLPMGTKIYIDGYGEYVVEDTGNMADNVIDIYIGDHNRAWNFGRQSAKVYLIKERT